MKKNAAYRVHILWLPGALALMLMLYFLASAGIGMYRKDMNALENEERINLARMETERMALQDEIALSGTDAYIEKLARTEYGYLKPGEIRFEITNPELLFGGNIDLDFSGLHP